MSGRGFRLKMRGVAEVSSERFPTHSRAALAL